ncbi:MAG TPA: hypothetical protein VIL95_07425 [Bacillota bacterium]
MLDRIIQRLQQLQEQLRLAPTKETLLAIDQELEYLQRWLQEQAPVSKDPEAQ